MFVAEGRLVVQRLLEDGRFAVESILVTPAAHDRLRATLARATAPVLVAPPEVLNAVAGFNFHRGCLALARRPEEPRSLTHLLHATRLMVLERVGNPDNIGGIFRAALALGAGGVLLDEYSADPLYRKAIRTSMAATLRVPFARMPMSDAIVELHANGFLLIGLTPGPDAVDISAVPRSQKMALLLGSEGEGLSPDVLAGSDVRARISIEARADSLNVAMAAAIALYAFR